MVDSVLADLRQMCDSHGVSFAMQWHSAVQSRIGSTFTRRRSRLITVYETSDLLIKSSFTLFVIKGQLGCSKTPNERLNGWIVFHCRVTVGTQDGESDH